MTHDDKDLLDLIEKLMNEVYDLKDTVKEHEIRLNFYRQELAKCQGNFTVVKRDNTLWEWLGLD